jgi:uncharacterized repeat protein (TIGR01451 family)
MAIIDGTSAAEFLDGTAENDGIRGFEGSDTVTGLDGNDDINGNQQEDLISGDLGDDTLRGGQDNDTVSGGEGNDLIFGDLGDDALYGGLGIDTLTGGGGNDVFAIGADTGGATAADADVINDFRGEGNSDADTIGLIGELTFEGLNITASGSDTVIQDRLTGQFLAVIQNFTGALTSADFSAAPDFEIPEPNPEEVSVDLSILAFDSVDPATVGSNFTYTVKVTNNSDFVATNGSIDILLPLGVEVVFASSSEGEVFADGQNVSLAFFEFPIFRSVTIDIEVTPIAAGEDLIALTGSDILTFTASVGASELDPFDTNNSLIETTKVNPVMVEPEPMEHPMRIG